MVSKQGIKPNPINVAKIVQWPVPTNVKEVRQFVAMGSYYLRFVKDFAKLVRPMVELTKKDVTFKWHDDCQRSFEDLKKILMSPNIMGYTSGWRILLGR